MDAGLIRLHMRARAGQRVEETARECDLVDDLIREVIPPHDLANILDNIGLYNSTINLAYSNSGVIGESDAEFMIGLKPDRSMSTKYYVDELRSRLAQEFPGHRIFLSTSGYRHPDSEFRRARAHRHPTDRPQPARPITNWRSRSPIEVQQIPGAVDVHVHQLFSYPTLFLDVDRTRAQSVGLSQQDVANSLLLSLSSSSQINPSFLGESDERIRIQRGRAGAAVSNRLDAESREYSDFFRFCPTGRKSC